MGKTLELVVESLLEKHTGGERYFDELDEAMRLPTFVETLVATVRKECNLSTTVFVVSGKFGKSVYERYSNIFKIIYYSGSLRGENTPTLVKSNVANLNTGNYDFVFLDDSYYAGRTLAKISTIHEISKAYVLYDGSKIKNPKVISQYRYFDNYDFNGNKKKCLNSL